MAKSVRDLPEEIQALIEVRNWDMQSAEAREFCKTAGVRKLPSLAVDGNLVYESVIPDQDELIEQIRQSFREDQRGHDGK